MTTVKLLVSPEGKTLLTMKEIADRVDRGDLSRDALVLPLRTAREEAGWSYDEDLDPAQQGRSIPSYHGDARIEPRYADAGQYWVLPAETAATYARWHKAGDVQPFAGETGEPEMDERLCLLVWPVEHVLEKAWDETIE